MWIYVCEYVIMSICVCENKYVSMSIWVCVYELELVSNGFMTLSMLVYNCKYVNMSMSVYVVYILESIFESKYFGMFISIEYLSRCIWENVYESWGRIMLDWECDKWYKW